VKTFTGQEAFFQTTAMSHKEHVRTRATRHKAPGHRNARIEVSTGAPSRNDNT
jgi:hypothetical protein